MILRNPAEDLYRRATGPETLLALRLLLTVNAVPSGWRRTTLVRGAD